jgi:citrate lyase subunit beta/citryl-CoA lyase
MPARSVNLLLSFETARGVQDAFALASASKRVTAVSAGTAEGGDLHAEMGGLWSDDIGTVPFVRTRVALAGRAAGLRSIIDGACTRLDDVTVARSASAARAAGYSGRWRSTRATSPRSTPPSPRPRKRSATPTR